MYYLNSWPLPTTLYSFSSRSCHIILFKIRKKTDVSSRSLISAIYPISIYEQSYLFYNLILIGYSPFLTLLQASIIILISIQHLICTESTVNIRFYREIWGNERRILFAYIQKQAATYMLRSKSNSFILTGYSPFLRVRLLSNIILTFIVFYLQGICKVSCANMVIYCRIWVL